MTARKILSTTVVAALVAGAALPAFAAPERGPGRHGGPGRAMMQDVTFVRLLKNADTDKDGKVSKDEMTAFQDRLFAAVDANKDGTLTRGEMLDYRQARMEEFAKNNPPPAAADTADNQTPRDPAAENKTAEERGEHRREHAGRHDRERDDRGGRGWGRQDARWDRDDRPHGGPMMRGGMFRMIDEDRDGKITKAEAVSASDKLFARMDANKDNAITIDDLPDRPL